MNQKRSIKIRFVDVYTNFDERNNMIHECLARRCNVQLSEDPDYLLYGVFGNSHLEYESPVRIMWTAEPVVPDFNLCDYAIGLDHIRFEDRYFRSLTWRMDILRQLCAHERSRVVEAPSPGGKSRFCNFLYSSSTAHPDRDRFFHLLNRYRRVDSGGDHLNNMGTRAAGPRLGRTWVRDAIEFRKPYKFSIAFENSLHNGYTTEKLPSAFLADTVPIYWGNPLVGRDYNTKAMINCHDYESFDDVVKRVIELDSDDEQWRATMAQPVFTESARSAWCGETTALEEFLGGIVDQPLRRARRRGQGKWNTQYFAHARNNALLRRSRAYRLIETLWRLHGMVRR